jgi:hypothetical protein
MEAYVKDAGHRETNADEQVEGCRVASKKDLQSVRLTADAPDAGGIIRDLLPV